MSSVPMLRRRSSPRLSRAASHTHEDATRDSNAEQEGEDVQPPKRRRRKAAAAAKAEAEAEAEASDNEESDSNAEQEGEDVQPPKRRRRKAAAAAAKAEAEAEASHNEESDSNAEQEGEDVQPPKRRRRKAAAAAAKAEAEASRSEEPDSLAALDEALQNFNAQENMTRIIEEKDALYAQLQAQFVSLRQASFERLDSAAERVSQSMESLEEGAVSAAQHLQNRINDMEEKDAQQQLVVQQQKDQLDLLRNETLALHNKVRKLEKQLEAKCRESEKVEKACDPHSNRIIETYQVLTGTRVTVLPKSDEDANVDVFECKCVDRRTKKLVVFHLSFNDEGEVQYYPQRIQFRGANVPDYLNEEVSFDIMETPRFMKNLLASVQKSA